MTLPAFHLNVQPSAGGGDEDASAEDLDGGSSSGHTAQRKSLALTTSARRSSMGLRGKRKSSGGDYLTQPHPEIEAGEFYNHINPDLPGPLRMRQLLIWTLQRQLAKQSEGPFPGVRDFRLCLLPNMLPDTVKTKEALEEVVQRLIHKQINVSWYQREVYPGNPPES